MPEADSAARPPGRTAVGVQAVYDAVARAYDARLGDELDGKPLDRALLNAFLELAAGGVVADVGCGPGHVTRYLAARHPDVVGIDISPRMIDIAHEHAPGLSFTVGSMLALPAADDAWSGAVALYSIIHLTTSERAMAFGELARVLRPGGWLLVSFHVESDDFAAGDVNHLTTWFGEQVELDGHFIDPAEIEIQLRSAGFVQVARMDRQPTPEVEYPSRRCYLLAQRR